MPYIVEVKINGYTSLITDCYDNEYEDNLWNLYEELCAVEEDGGTSEDFDEVLSDHGCSASGAGIMYDCEFQGFPVEIDDDGYKFVNINGIRHEIINLNYAPSVETSFAPAGMWSSWE